MDVEANSLYPIAMLTLHRASNVDNRMVFSEHYERCLVGTRNLLPRPVNFPVQSSTPRRLQEFGFEFSLGKGKQGNMSE